MVDWAKGRQRTQITLWASLCAWPLSCMDVLQPGRRRTATCSHPRLSKTNAALSHSSVWCTSLCAICKAFLPERLSNTWLTWNGRNPVKLRNQNCLGRYRKRLLTFGFMVAITQNMNPGLAGKGRVRSTLTSTHLRTLLICLLQQVDNIAGVGFILELKTWCFTC